MPHLIQELDQFETENFRLDILSRVPAADRIDQVGRYKSNPKRFSLAHLEGDYLVPSDLWDLNLSDYDTIVMLGSDRFETKEAADARTLLGFYLVQEIMGSNTSRPGLLVELFDPDNSNLIQGSGVEVLVSPVIISHILAHVALRPELNLVFSELFASGGAEIYFKPSRVYGLNGQELQFGQIQQMVSRQGDIALGICLGPEGSGSRPVLQLNPNREARWSLQAKDAIVVLTTLASPESVEMS